MADKAAADIKALNLRDRSEDSERRDEVSVLTTVGMRTTARTAALLLLFRFETDGRTRDARFRASAACVRVAGLGRDLPRVVARPRARSHDRASRRAASPPD